MWSPAPAAEGLYSRAISVLDTKTLQWEMADNEADSTDLPARCGHSIVRAGNQLIVFGGGDANGKFHNDWPSITIS